MPDRAATRTALADLLRRHVIVAAAVYRYPKLDLLNEAPVVTISDAGSGREPLARAGTRSAFVYDINVFVLQSAAGWTEEQAEDQLAAIEQQIATVVQEYRAAPPAWQKLEYEGRSNPRPLTMPGGVVYLWEIIRVVTHVY